MIPAPAPHLHAVVETHPGETGKINEDRYSVTAYSLGPEGTPVTLAVVADGIGGHRAGEVAAQIAVDTFVGLVAAYDGGDPVEHLRRATIESGNAIARAAQESPDREGMGSTLGAVLVIGKRLYMTTIGDSRVYLLRAGRLIQSSIDHTWVQEAIDHKIISPEAAHNHPHAHVLRRHLGSRLEPKPDFRLRLSPSESDEQSEANQGLALQPGDQVLVCTDGLTDLVRDYELAGALRKRSPQSAIHYLVGLARSRGGFDNITVLLLTVPRETSGGGCAARARFLVAAAISALLLVVFILAAVVGAWWFRLGPFQLASPTATATPTVTPTVTVEPSSTASPTLTTTSTRTRTATPTLRPTLTPSGTPIPTGTAASPSPSAATPATASATSVSTPATTAR